MPDNADSDEQALLLRDQGHSFATMAWVLNLANALEANAAYDRALRHDTLVEQAALRSREMARSIP